MVARDTLWVCFICIIVGSCAGCSNSTTKGPFKYREPDHIKVVIVNSGPSELTDVKVTIASQEFELGSFGPGVGAACKFLPRQDQIGKSATVVVEFEDENEEVIRLENQKEFKIASKGTIRLDIGENKILSEQIVMEP